MRNGIVGNKIANSSDAATDARLNMYEGRRGVNVLERVRGVGPSRVIEVLGPTSADLVTRGGSGRGLGARVPPNYQARVTG